MKEQDGTTSREGMDPERIGAEMHALMAELFPICRSISGDGVRKTLSILGRHLPLSITEVATGTRVLDWSVPKEWNIRDAYLIDPDGKKIVDFRESNLGVVGYSAPFRGRLTLEELKPHLHSIPEIPDVIPYRTSYYKENWGFCMPHAKLRDLRPGIYEAVIDSTLSDGSITLAECVIPGTTPDEIVISTYTCHPSLCNDNLSGVVLGAFLGKRIADGILGPKAHRFTYRILFIPETIGAIAWLDANRNGLDRIRHGLVASCVGDPGEMSYKRSRRGGEIDQAVAHMLRTHHAEPKISDFSPLGSDERQFCSPGFNLPFGLLSRSTIDAFKQYHTSADDLEFVRPAYLADSLAKYLQVLKILEGNDRYVNLFPYGEPQLGPRGLYRQIEGEKRMDSIEEAIFWVLNYSDGTNTLLDIADRSKLRFEAIRAAATALETNGLLKAGPALSRPASG